MEPGKDAIASQARCDRSSLPTIGRDHRPALILLRLSALEVRPRVAAGSP
jgi:hypothetical protein